MTSQPAAPAPRPRPGSRGDDDTTATATAGAGPAASLLPPLGPDGGVAVLVVDPARAEVLYANEVAAQLAPSVPFPCPLDAWSAAAGLEDVAGHALPAAGALVRVAQGRSSTVEALTARRASPATDARELLWALGVPLPGAPLPLAGLGLVVLLPARNAVAGVQDAVAGLRDRAVLSTLMSFTITDPWAEDQPLVWVNPAFTATTGYGLDEVVGRNCRFLQGEGTDPATVRQIRTALREQRPLTTTLLNYRKDGTPFWNELSLSPVRDGEGRLTHYVGVQADVTSRVEAQLARDEALDQVARSARRLSLLADFTSRMAMSRTPQQILQQLGDALVPQIGTWCLLYTLDETGQLAPAPYAVHERAEVDPATAALMDELRALVPEQLQETSPVLRVLRGEVRDVLIRDYAGEPAEITGAAQDERTDLLRQLDVRSALVVPLLARAGIVGCLAVLTDGSRPPFGEGDRALVQDLAVRAGLMLENAQLYAREKAAATTLQRSLLPRLPALDGFTVAAAYVPAADQVAVGGDWYDVFTVRGGGTVGVVVGDVMGHDIDSAARMGKLSTIVRSYGWPGSEPQVVLTAVDEMMVGGNLDILATCLYATLTPTATGATLRWSNAGHPPAIVRSPDGVVRLLEDARGPMIGISRLLGGSPRPDDAVLDLPSGSTFLCFTDGLVDAHSLERDLDEGLAELARVVASLPERAAPQAIVDALLGTADQRVDDVAVVALRVD